MYWIVCALLICIFMAFFTLRALSFEPVKFMEYTSEDYKEYKNSGLYIILSRTILCINILYFVIGAIVGLILGYYLFNSHIKIIIALGCFFTVAGIACFIVQIFMLLERILRKI